MSHGVRIRKDPLWSMGSTWKSSEATALDASLVAALHEGGGSWAPTSNVVIGGAGVRLILAQHLLSGVASLLTTNGTTALLTHNDNDYCVLGPGHTGATQTLVSPVSRGVSPVSWGATIDLLPIIGVTAPLLGATLRVPLRVHNGATLASVVFPWAVGSAGSTLGLNTVPVQMPRFGVFAKDAFGTKYPLIAAAPYQAPPTPSGGGAASAFYDSGLTQTLTYTCDSPGANPYVVIDSAHYTYFAEIVEVSGYPQAGVLGYFDLTATFSNIADIRPR